MGAALDGEPPPLFIPSLMKHIPGTEDWKKLAFAYIWGGISGSEFDDLRRLLTESA